MPATAPLITDQELLNLLDRTASDQLTTNQLRFMLLVSLSTPEKPTQSPTPMAAAMQISITAVSETGKGLQSRNLVTRKRVASDDRCVSYTLTPEGRTQLDSIRTGATQPPVA